MLEVLLKLPRDILSHILSYLELIDNSIYAWIDKRWIVFELEYLNDRVIANLYEKKIKKNVVLNHNA
jgi:hypothetical protein